MATTRIGKRLKSFGFYAGAIALCVPPLAFIPFAEQTGYIRRITLWVLERAIRQCADWKRPVAGWPCATNGNARQHREFSTSTMSTISVFSAI